MSMSKEVWRDIKGYEGLYQVSNMGRVKSLDRVVKHSSGGCKRLKEKLKSPHLRSDGYMTVVLCKLGKQKTIKIAKLVAIAFLNHTPNGRIDIIDHISGIKTNDKLSNLRIVSMRENCSTCFRKNEDNFTSQYVGVAWSKSKCKWQSTIYVINKNIHLGFFDIELDASNAYQKALLNIDNLKYFENIDTGVRYTSNYKGVTWDKLRNRWIAQITIEGKRKFLGRFVKEYEAHLAYEKALKEMLKD